MVEQSMILIDTATADPDQIRFLENLGHRVVICQGPPHGVLCPILKREGCDKAEKAHGIVFDLDLDRPQHRAILAQYQKSLREDVPIRVVVTPEQAVRHDSLLAGVQVWTHEPWIGELDGFAAQVEASDRFHQGEGIA